jgi:predicted dehydrogenase
MNLSEKSILLIGNGKWSRKIQSILQDHSDNYRGSIVSASEMLEKSKSRNALDKVVSEYDLFWIATSPEKQLQLATIFSMLGKYLILEKPVFTSLSSLRPFLTETDISRGKIFISEPWSHSMLWQASAKRMLTSKEIVKIKGHRKGPAKRDGFSSPLDWMPHDLYLINSLINQSDSPEIQLEHSSYANDCLEMSYKISNRFEISLTAGYAESRCSNWEVESSSGLKLYIDFDNSKLENGTIGFEETIEYITDHPVLNMLDNIFSGKVETNWEIICSRYSELLKALEK